MGKAEWEVGGSESGGVARGGGTKSWLDHGSRLALVWVWRAAESVAAAGGTAGHCLEVRVQGDRGVGLDRQATAGSPGGQEAWTGWELDAGQECPCVLGDTRWVGGPCVVTGAGHPFVASECFRGSA